MSVVDVEQLALPGLRIEPTPAMERGEQRVHMCAYCGTVVVTSSTSGGITRGCPCCGGETWWRQQLPVAGLHAEHALAPSAGTTSPGR